MQNQRLGLLLVLVALWSQGAAAQSAQQLLRTHQYTKAIQELGTVPETDRPYALGRAHLRRGYLLRDLARFEALLGASVYTWRDTSEDARPSQWASFFAFRHQVVAKEESSFQAVRDRVRRSALPARYENRAQVWWGLVQYRRGNERQARELWQTVPEESPAVSADLALAHWHARESLPPLKCGSLSRTDEGPPVLRCALLSAIRSQEWKEAVQIQQRLLTLDHPADVVDDFEVEGVEDFSVSFYDPGTLLAAAIADFRLAAAAMNRASQGRKRAPLFAGIAALEARSYEVARRALSSLSSPIGSIYKASLEMEAGSSENPQELWKNVRQAGNVRVGVLWAEEASQYEVARQSVEAYCQKLANKNSTPAALKRMKIALRLGRAALQIERPQLARKILGAAYEVGKGNNLAEIDPAFLTVYTLAKHLTGAHQTKVLNPLDTLQEAYPINGILYGLAQIYYQKGLDEVRPSN